MGRSDFTHEQQLKQQQSTVTLFFLLQQHLLKATKRLAQLKKLEKREMKQKDIVVRGFMNEKFGATYGKGLFYRAIYNGSVELRNPYSKYLIDLFEYGRWEVNAKSDGQLTWTKRLARAQINEAPEALASWIQHYDPAAKLKTPVDGVCIYLPISQELYISINDPAQDINEEWTLKTNHCLKSGPNKPIFIATNFDLIQTP